MAEHDRTPPSPLRRPDWYKTATRWTQLTLAENDPDRFSPDFWIEVFKRTRSNAACLSAGGYIAYYPSRIPLHHVSRYIGDRDPFGALVTGARAEGMHVMARIDPHAIHQEAADARPDWIAVDREGRPRRHWAYPKVWVTCAYGDYNANFIPKVIEEIVATYDIDAVFANRWQGHGVCYCDSCKTRFEAASGFPLPVTADAEDPIWRAWSAWRRTILTETVIAWDRTVKAIRPHAGFIPNLGGASLTEFDLALIEAHCPFLVVDDQGRQGVEPVWAAGRNGKRMRATFKKQPVILITSIGPEEAYRWKDSVTTAAEIDAWITNGVTHGMRPWFTKFNGVVPDQRWLAPVAAAYARHEALEPVLATMVPSAEIALIEPATTLRHVPQERRRQAEADDLGFYHALIEAKLPFEMLSDQMMTDQALDRFELVILANAACLSDAQCSTLRAYVARGGNILAAGETATRDENGKARTELGLHDVLGARLKRPIRGPVKNTYIALNGDHALQQGFSGATRIIGGTRLIGVEAANDVCLPFLCIPEYPDLPMEEVYAREAPHEPAAITRETGSGARSVYFPWNIGGVFWEVLAADHQRLIENAVRWALKRPPRVEVSGRSVVDVAVRENPAAATVLLFNLTNPMMLKGPIREVHPVGEHRVTMTVPKGSTGARARSLIGNADLEAQVVDGRITVTVPSIDLLEVVHLCWTA